MLNVVQILDFSSFESVNSNSFSPPNKNCSNVYISRASAETAYKKKCVITDNVVKSCFCMQGKHHGTKILKRNFPMTENLGNPLGYAFMFVYLETPQTINSILPSFTMCIFLKYNYFHFFLLYITTI